MILEIKKVQTRKKFELRNQNKKRKDDFIMMLRPAIGNLLDKITTEENVGTRYELVIAVAKRAREINEKNNVKMTEANAVSLAVKEIADGKVNVSIPQEEKASKVIEDSYTKIQFDIASEEA